MGALEHYAGKKIFFKEFLMKWEYAHDAMWDGKSRVGKGSIPGVLVKQSGRKSTRAPGGLSQ